MMTLTIAEITIHGAITTLLIRLITCTTMVMETDTHLTHAAKTFLPEFAMTALTSIVTITTGTTLLVPLAAHFWGTMIELIPSTWLLMMLTYYPLSPYFRTATARVNPELSLHLPIRPRRVTTMFGI